MKRLIFFVICLLSLQIVKADNRLLPASVKISATLQKSAAKAYGDTSSIKIANPIPLTGYENIIKLRLDSIKKDVPLDYNEYVQNYIDLYLHNRDEMGHVLGLAKYYFPIYEKAFRDAGIPAEIEYLSIVESKLDPNAISRVGATGPWQFMGTTARLYGLNMDGYVDERRDPVQASYAAAAYLKDAYEEFGDWLLAIASYNCGKSNIEIAMQKAGANDFWSIRQYLPAETRNYVPAYIAVAYVMNYYNRHNIIPQPCNFATGMDTVLVDKFVSLNSISTVLKIDAFELALLNPSYTRQIINGSARAPRRLVIPHIAKEQFAALYNALNNAQATLPAVPQVTYTAYHDNDDAPKIPAYHKVRRGETLASIADKYGMDENDLRSWNHLHHSKAIVGQRLRLTADNGDESDADSAPVKHSVSYITYKVKEGDTLSVIASKFDGASVDKIKSLNGLKKTHLQAGMTLKISRG
jgi:membrane-bound lytic murein transglycosylase D